jgi:ATP synthase protein I
MLGAIGWTVVLPALLGLALGAWLEQARNLTVSCKLPGLLAGLLFGCGAAWQRVRQEWLSLKREEESADEL